MNRINKISFIKLFTSGINGKTIQPTKFLMATSWICQQKLDFQSTCNHFNVFKLSDKPVKEGFYARIKKKIYYHCHKKYIYRAKGFLLYRHASDNLDYIQMMKDFEMEDTFFSWFLITELHIWMLLVRLSAAGDDGEEMKNILLQAMWHDVDARKSVIGNIRGSDHAKQIEQLGMQFNAALIGYDEGINSNDMVLANAVWNRFFDMKSDNPELVEKLVIHIRKTISKLDKLPNDVFVKSTKLEWLDYQKPKNLEK